jgi:hypothetical protein
MKDIVLALAVCAVAIMGGIYLAYAGVQEYHMIANAVLK